MTEAANPNVNEITVQKPLYKKPGFYAGLVIILIVLTGGINYFLSSLEYVTSDDAYIDANRLDLSAQIMGRVKALYMDEGDSVKTGQLLAVIDSTDLVARYNLVKANYNSARAGLELARVNLNNAQIDFNRTAAQYKDKVIPKSQYDHSRTAFDAAQAQLKIARTRVATSLADIDVVKANLAHTQIFSPVKGIIAKRWVLNGDIVQPGLPIYSIYETDKIWVTAMLEETRIASLSLNDNVGITVDAYPDNKFSGKIYQIGTNTAAQFALIPPSNAAGNFTKVTQRIPIKISIVNQSPAPLKYGLLPGMSVEVSIKVENNE